MANVGGRIGPQQLLVIPALAVIQQLFPMVVGVFRAILTSFNFRSPISTLYFSPREHGRTRPQRFRRSSVRRTFGFSSAVAGFHRSFVKTEHGNRFGVLVEERSILSGWPRRGSLVFVGPLFVEQRRGAIVVIVVVAAIFRGEIAPSMIPRKRRRVTATAARRRAPLRPTAIGPGRRFRFPASLDGIRKKKE